MWRDVCNGRANGVFRDTSRRPPRACPIVLVTAPLLRRRQGQLRLRRPLIGCNVPSSLRVTSYELRLVQASPSLPRTPIDEKAPRDWEREVRACCQRRPLILGGKINGGGPGRPPAGCIGRVRYVPPPTPARPPCPPPRPASCPVTAPPTWVPCRWVCLSVGALSGNASVGVEVAPLAQPKKWSVKGLEALSEERLRDVTGAHYVPLGFKSKEGAKKPRPQHRK